MVEKGSDLGRTLSDADLAGLREIDSAARQWAADMPSALAAALSVLSSADAREAEEDLARLLDEHGDNPEVWWGLAVAMVAQNDLRNASTCYENFRDRVEIEVALAVRDSEREPDAAHRRLRRLAPSLVRCQDWMLAARGLIMASGLSLMFEETKEALVLLRDARDRMQRIWPRPAGLVAEWLATIAAANAALMDSLRSARSLRLALRFARREPANCARIAAIGRDLGLLLSHADRYADAETILAAAMEAAQGGTESALQLSIAIAQAQNLLGQRRYIEAIGLIDGALASELSDQLRALALMASADAMTRLGGHYRDRSQLEAAEAAAKEAVILLRRARLDATAALRDQAVAAAMLGDRVTAREILFALLGSGDSHLLPPSERVALAYVPYLIRMSEGRARAALGWAEYRLRVTTQARIERPRDMLLLREHCIAAAERLEDLATVRRHALAMLDAEAGMLRVALGQGRGPAEWNRFRIAREGLSVLAAMEARTDSPGKAWRQTEALLAGRGLARTARRSLRRSRDTTDAVSVRAFAARLAPDEVLLALVSMHPPAPVDPDFPWASGFSAPRLIGILVKASDTEPEIADLGDFRDCASGVRRWTRDLAVGRITRLPAFLDPLGTWLSDARTVFVVAEGAMELVPVRLLASHSVVRQMSGAQEAGRGGASTMPVVLVASDMLEEPFVAATEREASLVCAAVAGAQCRVIGETGEASALEMLTRAPRHIHIIAHGSAVLDPGETGLDVYQGAAVELGGERLTASAVADLHLEGVELVILSSCDTSKGATQHAEGLASMAAAFLDAGAAVVIATLWPVPHEETAAFMALLYAENLAEPALALARAQDASISEGLDPSCWAAWVAHETGFNAGAPCLPGQSTTA